MKNKLLIACVVIVLGILAFGTISASAATEGIYTYSVSGGEATITDCSTSASGDIIIPSTLGGYPVTSIGDDVFRGCTSLTSITIGDGVTSIGDRAFMDCTSLKSVTIPDSVTSIGYAFNVCTSLTNINVDENNQYFSSDERGVLFNKDKTTLFQYPIGKSTTSYSIPDSVTSIGDYAFYYCTSLESVTIPDSVTSIGDGAFFECYSLTSITIPKGITSIGDSTFQDCTSITNITIPDSVTSIGDYAFCGCISLESITIPNNVTGIGYRAFRDCTRLTSITIPDNVTSVGEEAFNRCTSLTSVTIGSSVTSIGYDAFHECTSLTSVNITDIAAWCNISFSNYSSNPLYYAKKLYLNGELVTELVIPDGVTSIGDDAFYNCTSLTSITIPDSVTSIGDYGFYNCTNFASVNITDISAWCNISFGSSYSNPLYYAKKLYLNGELVTELVIPDSIISIGSWAFSNCTCLLSIKIPNCVTSIGNGAFYGCENITNITIPDSVTSIGNSAFSGCESLTSVTIPDSVTSIGDYAFQYCTKLKTVYYSGTADKWNKISIGSKNSSLTSANRIYLVNIKIVCETGEEISFFHISGNAIDASSIPQKQYHTPIFYKDENRTEKISVDTPISESTTLYLGYEPTLYTHIFRDENGAVIKTESVPYGTVITPPEAPEKEATDDFSYTFAGWKDFTSGMTQTDVELVFVAEYDATLNILEKFKLSCDCKVEIGSTFDLTASFATNTPAQYIYLTLAIPDGLEINKITPIDFIEISLEGKKSEGGYTYFTYLGVFDYNSTDIPKNEKIVPFNIELEASTDVVAGEYPILVTEASLINNEGSFIPFENAQGVTITVKKLAESITISGPSSIDKPTSFTATFYPDYTSNKEVLWSVSDETVAEITENGLLTPIKNGTVIVSATAADGSGCVASKSVEIIKYAEITSLSSDVGVWDKAFSPDVYEYTIAVFGDVSSITLTPTFNGGVLRPNGTGLWISGTKKSFDLGEDTTTITLVRQNVTDNTNSTYTVNVVKAKSEFVGAQIRTDDPQGLRFVFSIPRAVYDAIEHPESPDDIGLGFGSVVMPKKYLGDNELTKETEVTLNGIVYKSKIAPAVNLFEITDDEVKFTACLIEIPEKNYSEEYVAIPYMTYIENGEEITVYGEKTEGITVFTIAEMAYADNKTSEVDKEYLYNNILSVVDPKKYPTNK